MMRELKENLEPLNQKAREFLKQVKEVPDGSGLYCLQLAKWAIENRKIKTGYQVEEQINLMYGWNPENAMKFVTKVNRGLEDRIMPDRNPEELAWSIVDAIEDKLVDLIGYNKAKMG